MGSVAGMLLALLLAAVSAEAARAYSLISYVAGDYAAAVAPSGAVVSQQELDEQLIFAADAARDLETAGAGDLAASATALGSRISAKASPAEIVPLARSLAGRIARRFQLTMLPRRSPDLRRGRATYRQSCAACHGASGVPRDKVLGLSTRPTAFASREEIARLSPQRIFAAVSFGVPGTAMPSFAGAIDEDAIWDLAFSALLIACPQRSTAQGERVAKTLPRRPDWLQLAVRSDEQLRSALSYSPLSPAEREALICAIRARWSEPKQDAPLTAAAPTPP